MNLKRRAVHKLDQLSPRLMGNLRYHLHVSLRRQIVFPDISKMLYARIDAPHRVAIDVGANVGIFTRYLSRHFGAVTSVEPVPYLADRLRSSAPANCRVVGKALGDREGEVTLRIPQTPKAARCTHCQPLPPATHCRCSLWRTLSNGQFRSPRSI